MFSKISLVMIIFAIFASTSFASDSLIDEWEPQRLADLQKTLIKEGYIEKSKVKLGVYSYETQLAYSKWNKERIKQNMLRSMEEMKVKRDAERVIEEAKRIEEERIEAERYAKLSNFEKAIEYVQKIIKNIVN